MKSLLTTCLILMASMAIAQYDSLSRFTYSFDDPARMDQFIGQEIQWLPLYDKDSSYYLIKDIVLPEWDDQDALFILDSNGYVIERAVKPVRLERYKTFILTGYLAKLESRFANSEIRFVQPVDGIRDMTTRKKLTVNAGDIWRYEKVAVARDLYYQPCLYLVNGEGQQIRLTADYWKGEVSVKMVEKLVVNN